MSLIKEQGIIATQTFLIDLTLVGMDAIYATGFKSDLSVDESVVAEMPRTVVTEQQLIFLKIEEYVSHEQLEIEAEKRNLFVANPYVLAAFNGANPKFVNKCSNFTQWKNTKSIFCCITFDRFNIGHCVRVGESHNRWGGCRWLACVSK